MRVNLLFFGSSYLMVAAVAFLGNLYSIRKIYTMLKVKGYLIDYEYDITQFHCITKIFIYNIVMFI